MPRRIAADLIDGSALKNHEPDFVVGGPILPGKAGKELARQTPPDLPIHRIERSGAFIRRLHDMEQNDSPPRAPAIACAWEMAPTDF